MLVFKDFVPRQLQAPRFGFTTTALQGEYETLDAAVRAANEWIAQHGVRVLNVETVVLPNLWAGWEHGSTDPAVGSGQGAHLWHQFIRLWYEDERPAHSAGE